jgi:hypothetical protein
MILAYSLLEEVNYLQHFHYRNQLDIVRQKMHIVTGTPGPYGAGPYAILLLLALWIIRPWSYV